MAIGTIGALALGTLGSSLIGGISSNKAAKAQTNAANDANETQRYIFDRSVELSEPYRNAGQNALAILQGAGGIGDAPSFGSDGSRLHLSKQGNGTWAVAGENGDVRHSFNALSGAQDFMRDRAVKFDTSPGYRFRQSEGRKAIERGAAARGLRMSGGTMKDMSRFNQGLASSEYGNWWNQMAGLSGVGQAATSQQIQAGQNYANAYGNNVLTAGNARASGYQGVNNALQSGINNGFNIFGMQQAGMFG